MRSKTQRTSSSWKLDSCKNKSKCGPQYPPSLCLDENLASRIGSTGNQYTQQFYLHHSGTKIIGHSWHVEWDKGLLWLSDLSILFLLCKQSIKLSHISWGFGGMCQNLTSKQKEECIHPRSHRSVKKIKPNHAEAWLWLDQET